MGDFSGRPHTASKTDRSLSLNAFETWGKSLGGPNKCDVYINGQASGYLN